MKKILITDSLKSLLEMDGSILSKKNTRIFFAASGEKIIKIHKAENVDLIITDLDLPGMNGDDVISIIRRDDVLRKVSTILICDNNKSSIVRCKISGTNAFIMKPVQHEELFLNINKLLYVTERRNLRIILQVFINCKTSDNFFFANSVNISSTGILFETSEILKEGEKVLCAFFIERDPIIIKGEVKRVERKPPHQYFYGMQFLELNHISKYGIEKFIEHQKHL